MFPCHLSRERKKEREREREREGVQIQIEIQMQLFPQGNDFYIVLQTFVIVRNVLNSIDE